METAQAVGVDPTKVNYVSYDGGGDLLTALLGKKIAAGTSGLGEYVDQIEAGQVRVLAVSGEERVEGVDAPDADRGGHRPEVHELARSPCAARHLRR